MQSEKFTALVRNAIGAAQSAALAANHQKLTPEHVLSALLSDDNMTVKMLLAKSGADSMSLSAQLKAALDKLPQVTGSGAGQLQLDADLARIFAAVESEAKARHDQFIAVDLLLLAMAKSTGSVGEILKKAGVERRRCLLRLTKCGKGAPPTVMPPKIVMMRYHAILATLQKQPAMASLIR